MATPICYDSKRFLMTTYNFHSLPSISKLVDKTLKSTMKLLYFVFFSQITCETDYGMRKNRGISKVKDFK